MEKKWIPRILPVNLDKMWVDIKPWDKSELKEQKFQKEYFKDKLKRDRHIRMPLRITINQEKDLPWNVDPRPHQRIHHQLRFP